MPVPDLVAIDLPQDDALIEVILSIWDDGDALCIIDPRLSPNARARALSAMRPTVLFDRDGRKRLVDGEPTVEGDALVVLSSGSMADPKAIIHTRSSLEASAKLTSARLGVDPERDRWLCCLPIAHIGGFSVIARSLVTQTPLTILPGPQPASLIDAAHRGATHVSLVATSLKRIDPQIFSLILLGGAAAPPVLPVNVVATYGMTETGSGIVYNGLPLDGVDISIDAPDPAGLGEIMVRTPTLMRAFRDGGLSMVADPQGGAPWFATGDLGRLDPQGSLAVSGRIADVIVTGGEKVLPSEVERVIRQALDVVDVAVWKRSDPEWGERVVAWVVAGAAPITLDSVRQVVKEQLAPYAAPKEIVFVDEIPRSPLGKLQRQALS
jgi:O-succinylbenzoic acid--CoA ligase